MKEHAKNTFKHSIACFFLLAAIEWTERIERTAPVMDKNSTYVLECLTTQNPTSMKFSPHDINLIQTRWENLKPMFSWTDEKSKFVQQRTKISQVRYMEKIISGSYVRLNEKNVELLRDAWKQCGWKVEHKNLLHDVRIERNKVAHTHYSVLGHCP